MAHVDQMFQFENIIYKNDIILSFQSLGLSGASIDFIIEDLVFLFIVGTLWLIFKSIKWVIMPLLGCATSVIIMTGLLGLIGWKVTVISSDIDLMQFVF